MSEVKRYKLLQDVRYDDGAFVIPAGQVVIREADYDVLRDERDRLALDLRKRIWLLHGSRMNHLLYGDDGRMDCNVCLREYAGATLEQCYEWEIADACALVAKAALTPAGGQDEHK